MESTETIDIKKIESETGVDKKVVEVYKYLSLYMGSTKRKEWENKRKDNWEAVKENKMTSELDKKELNANKMDDLVINKCDKGVQGSAAIVTDKKPEMKYLPIGSGDKYVAELMKRGNDVIWSKNSGNDIVYEDVEELKIGGLSWIDVKFNPNKGYFGRIEIEETPPDDIYFSEKSRARDFSDTHIIKAKLRTLSYIKKHYPDLDTKDILFGQDLQNKEEDDPQKSSGLTGKDNYTTPSEPGESSEESEKMNIWEIEAWMLDTVEKDYFAYVDDFKRTRMVEIPEQDKDDKKKRPDFVGEYVEALKKKHPDKKFEHRRLTLDVRELRIIVGKKLYSVEENPHSMDSDGDPILGLIGLRHDRTLHGYPTCPTDKALPINREKNKRRAQFRLSASQNVNSPILQYEGTVKWDGHPGAPGSIGNVSHNAPTLPTRLPPGSMDIHKFAELEQLADKDIQDVYDFNDVMAGKLPQGMGQVAGRTVLALQDMGSMMSKPFLRKLEGKLVRVAKAYMALAFKHWPREMWARLIEADEMEAWTPKGMLSEEERNDEISKKTAQKWLEALDKIAPLKEKEDIPDLGGGALSMIDIDVAIVAGSSMPTNRMAKQAVAVDLVKGGIYDRKAALEFMDDPKADEVAERMEKVEQQAAQMAMAKGKK